ncbi:preprotein translocase subunit Sec61beta [archaeon]|jgi:preprotein translocase subunit Sec61beta|nr:preprotein translocase subunit Sec61beta [archaeon]MBT6697722.1 preprotein translocase subunit Sec61beta [archaeon]
MAKDNKVHMPSGQGGLTRYFDESSSKMQFSPHMIVVASIVIFVLLIILHVVGNRFFG